MGRVDAVIPVIIALIAPIPTSNCNYLPLEPAPDPIYSHPSYSLRLSTAPIVPFTDTSMHENWQPYTDTFVFIPLSLLRIFPPDTIFAIRSIALEHRPIDFTIFIPLKIIPQRERWNNINSSRKPIFFHETCAPSSSCSNRNTTDPVIITRFQDRSSK